eukprot:5111151-Heterocapsa_arctica.AAC.1
MSGYVEDNVALSHHSRTCTAQPTDSIEQSVTGSETGSDDTQTRHQLVTKSRVAPAFRIRPLH